MVTSGISIVRRLVGPHLHEEAQSGPLSPAVLLSYRAVFKSTIANVLTLFDFKWQVFLDSIIYFIVNSIWRGTKGFRAVVKTNMPLL